MRKTITTDVYCNGYVYACFLHVLHVEYIFILTKILILNKDSTFKTQNNMRKTITNRLIVHVYIFHTYKHMCIVMFMFSTGNTCGVYFHTSKNHELC
jgi:hypothetical protein